MSTCHTGVDGELERIRSVTDDRDLDGEAPCWAHLTDELDTRTEADTGVAGDRPFIDGPGDRRR